MNGRMKTPPNEDVEGKLTLAKQIEADRRRHHLMEMITNWPNRSCTRKNAKKVNQQRVDVSCKSRKNASKFALNRSRTLADKADSL